MKDKTSVFKAATTAIAIIASFLLAFIIILLVSEQPMEAMTALLLGPVSSLRNFGNVVELMTTFMFTGMAISIMFQAGQFNVGAEGAFFFGGLIAAATAIGLNLGFFISPLLAIILGAAAGAAVTFVPAILKAKLNANELVVSLMMNYAIFFFGMFLLNYFLRDPQHGALASGHIPDAAKLPNIVPGTRINVGLIIAVGVVIVMYYFVNRTRTGYEIRATGQNKDFAGYSGIKVTKIIIVSQLLGGAIAGMGGAAEVLGMHNRFQWVATPGYGWDGVVVAILAYNKPQYIPLAAFFLAYLRIGSDIMARATDIPRELIIIIQSVIVLLISASGLLDRFKHKMIVKEVVTDGNGN